MSSSDSPTANCSELILKTEKYDIDGTTTSFQPPNQPPPSAFLKSISSSSPPPLTNRLGIVNFNNNNSNNNNDNNSNSNKINLSPASPKLEPSFCTSLSSSPIDKMPIPTVSDLQSTTIAGTTPGQHSISPSLPQQPTPTSLPAQSLMPNGTSPSEQLLNSRRMTSILGGYGLVPPGILGPLDHYRLQLYSYAMNVERLRGCGAPQQYPGPIYSGYPGGPTGPVSNGPYAPTRFALSMGLFPNRMFQPEEPKPQHSYIGLIAMAILSSAEAKLVLSDIYQHILDNYPYFRTRGPGWRNSIRHNLSLNDCFIKAGRSANGKGHYWAIHPANMDDFRKGDFRRRKAQRKVRKHMGLAVDDEGTDSPSPPPLAVTPPPMAPPPHPGVLLVGSPYGSAHHPNHQHYANSLSSVIIGNNASGNTDNGNGVSTTTTAAGVIANLYSQTRKRQFDVASLLAPDDTTDHQTHHLPLLSKQRITLTEDEDIDVVASDVDVDDEQEHILRADDDSYHNRHPNAHNYHSQHHQPHHHHHQQQNQHQQHHQHQHQHQHQHEHQHQQQDFTHSSYSPPPQSLQSDSSNRHYQTSSPVSQHESSSSDLPPLQVGNNLNPTANNWQGLMQHWPNEFGTAAAAAAAAMDPRIFGRYYSQYMAAAAARRVVGVFPAAAAAAAAAVIGHQNNATKQQQHSPTLQQKQQQQQSYEC